jgi:hypothetical protein
MEGNGQHKKQNFCIRNKRPIVTIFYQKDTTGSDGLNEVQVKGWTLSNLVYELILLEGLTLSFYKQSYYSRAIR